MYVHNFCNILFDKWKKSYHYFIEVKVISEINDPMTWKIDTSCASCLQK